MIRTADLSSLVCVCGVPVNFHRIGGAQISCAEARDRQILCSEQPLQAVERDGARDVSDAECLDRRPQLVRQGTV